MWYPGVVPEWKKVGVYGSIGAPLFGVVPEGCALEDAPLSEAELEGGVKRLPTLTAAVFGCIEAENGGYF